MENKIVIGELELEIVSMQPIRYDMENNKWCSIILQLNHDVSSDLLLKCSGITEFIILFNGQMVKVIPEVITPNKRVLSIQPLWCKIISDNIEDKVEIFKQ